MLEYFLDEISKVPGFKESFSALGLDMEYCMDSITIFLKSLEKHTGLSEDILLSSIILSAEDTAKRLHNRQEEKKSTLS